MLDNFPSDQRREYAAAVKGTLLGRNLLLIGNTMFDLEKISQLHPHFVISDLSMPEMNGWEMLAELEKNRAAVFGMQLIALVAFAVDVVGNAHAEPLRTLRPRFRIVAVENQHVAAAASCPLQEPAGGGPRARRADDLEEPVGADGKKRILQPVFRDAAVAVAFFNAEERPD